MREAAEEEGGTERFPNRLLDGIPAEAPNAKAEEDAGAAILPKRLLEGAALECGFCEPDSAIGPP